MNLRRHLLLSIGGAFALLFIAIATGLVALRAASDDFTEALNHDIAFQDAIAALYANGLQAASSLRGVVIDPQNQTGYENLKKGLTDFELALKKARSLPPIEGLAPDTLASIETQHVQRKGLIEKVMTLAKSDQAGAIDVLNKEEIPLWRKIRAQILEADKAVRVAAGQTEANSRANSQRLFTVTLTLGILAFAMASFSLIVITRRLSHSLGADPAEVARIARNVSQGNLREAIPNAPAGSVLHAMGEMQTKLIQTVGSINDHAKALTQAAASLSSNEHGVAESVSSQTGDLNAMAAAVEELTVSIRQVADLAKETAEIAQRSGAQAVQGQTVIQRLTDEMDVAVGTVRDASSEIDRLEQASARIATVVQTIQEVAEQTNLLALNAAIEAARAGEQGRGFAVVADEVRKLAERTALSTTEIRQTIGNVRTGIDEATRRMNASVEAINGSATLVEEAQRTITEMNTATEEVVRTVNEIAHSINEQTSVSTLIAQRVETISQAAEQNASAVMEEVRETDAVRTRAEELERTVSVFLLP